MSLLLRLLPRTARVTATGVAVGGCDLSDLADAFGTPLVVYDEEHLRCRCAEFRDAFPDGVSYASKAFLCLAMARLVHSEGLSLDVASGGEMAVAVAAGVRGDRLVLHGNNKSAEELASALAAGVARIVLDSDDEIARLTALVDQRTAVPPKVLVRLNPNVTVDTHAFITTGHAGSKFGFRMDTGDASRAARRVAADPRLDLAGVHLHVGSQLLDLGPVGRAVSAAAGFANEIGAEELSVGGGLGVDYTGASPAPVISEWAGLARDAAGARGFSGRVVAEPGRSLAAAAGVTLYRIGTIKHGPAQTFISVDGGLSDNPRPALYGSAYEGFVTRDPRLRDELPDGLHASVVGKNCESGDTLIKDAVLPENVSVGDVLCIPVTGAYTHAMSSNYNKLPRPAVVFARNGRATLVVRRETLEDLLRSDVMPDDQKPSASVTPAQRW